MLDLGGSLCPTQFSIFANAALPVGFVGDSAVGHRGADELLATGGPPGCRTGGLWHFSERPEALEG